MTATATPLAEISDVRRHYRRGERTIAALDGVTLTIQPHEYVALTGPSGSGKSTLINLLAALDRPDSGTIRVAGIDLATLKPTAAARYRRDQVGVVFQAYHLLPQLTALDNVLLPTLANGTPDPKRARSLLDAVGLADRAAHRPGELSGGEQQRVAIARALANNPPLLLADEPTGNLDDDSGRIVIDLLESACRQQGRALILATHDPRARDHADRTIALDHGRLRT